MCYSQNQSNIWYFGGKAGVDFNSGVPVALTDGQMQVDEGCSTISDANGQLLFYTNGIKVWNREHEVMPNGINLLGDNSSTQSSVVIPKPGSSSVYYIFTTNALADWQGARYTEVDMTLDNGLGDVTANKNILLITPSCEKIAAVKKADDSGYWVVLHGYESNDFLAYSVTDSGIAASPVVTGIGSIIGDVNATVGYLKFSPDGSKLVSSNYSKKVELFDFDATTGTLSNLRVVSQHLANYGVEFSPSGNVLYLTTGSEYILDLYQYDITAADISSTEVLLYHADSFLHQPGALQLAVDGKIYLPVFDEAYLSVINNPELLGTGCNFAFNSVSLAGRMAKAGLPQFIQSYFDVSITFQNNCLGQSTNFSLSGNQNIISANWDFGDGNSSSQINPSHTYSQPGSYTVSVTATTAGETVTESREVTISGIPIANPLADVNLCGTAGMQYDLAQHDAVLRGTQDSAIYGVAYFLTQQNAIEHTNGITATYTLPIGTTTLFGKVYNLANRQCHGITSFNVTLNLQPVAAQPSDYIICESLPYDNTEQFNLASKKSEILNGQDSGLFSLSFHASQQEADNRENPLPILYTNTASNEIIYARLENIGNHACYDTVSFVIGVVQQPVLGTISNYTLCDDISGNGVEVFDLNQKNSEILGGLPASLFTVRYYTSAENANDEINEITAPYQNAVNNQQIFATVQAIGNHACKAIANFNLVVSNTPQAFTPDDLLYCDEANDGVEFFDLATQVPYLIGNQNSASLLVTFYTSASNASDKSNPLSTNYQNTSNPQIIYARVENSSNPNCFTLSSFRLVLNPKPSATQPADMYNCALTDEVAAVFDLHSQDLMILNGQDSTTFDILYFGSESDAETNNNPLPYNYESTSAGQTIYARMHNLQNISCYTVTHFQIITIPKPIPLEQDNYFLCNGDSVEISAFGDYDTYLWSTGATDSIVRIEDTGDYSLTVTQNVHNIECSSTTVFSVVPSSLPISISVETREWTENNNEFTVNVNGEGHYEYSIDGINYQDSPQFDDLAAGSYRVYVNDKNGCGMKYLDVHLLNYPKFFTPNNDGINDFWRIKFSERKKNFEVFIFDRYGKFIVAFDGDNSGWDGTFNNHPLPSNDYWFVIYCDSKIERGHFSLLR